MAEARGGAVVPPEIVWNANEGKFETLDKEAFLQYHVREVALSGGDGEGGEAKEKKKMMMDVVHTYVPPSKRGKGIASFLCDAAFLHAKGQALLVIPTCSYVSGTYLPRHPSWTSLVYNEDSEGPKSSM